MSLIDRVFSARRVLRQPWAVAVAAFVAAAFTVLLLALALAPERHSLRVAAGDPIGRRFQIAEALARESLRHGLRLQLMRTEGSRAALEKVESGELDVALVQGGLTTGDHVREVGALVIEPLHLLVRRELGATSIHDLRGKRVNLSVRGSGTFVLARQVLRQAGLEGARGVRATHFTYEQLETLPPAELPEAVFLVSTVPSPVATFLIRERDYVLLEIPFAEALALGHAGWRPVTIPAYSYAGDPPEPESAMATVGTRLLVVARADAPPRAVHVLFETLVSERFLRRAELPRIDDRELLERPEAPLHEGTLDYLGRDRSVFTHELIDNLESLRSFFVSLAVAVFLLWRWWRARQLRGFDSYITEVSRLEKQIQELELQAELDVEKLLRIRQSLGQIKARSLDEYAEGRLGETELLSSFLLQITDVRMHLDALLLHARERLEKKALRTGTAGNEDAILAELWSGAVGARDEPVE